MAMRSKSRRRKNLQKAMNEPISFRQSSDGSVSAYNAEYNECYHSLKDGALSETFYKHIFPSLKHLSLENLPKTLCVLDMCFGLGYNSLTLLSALARGEWLQYRGRVKIYSPEKDRHVFSMLHTLDYPPFIRDTFSDMKAMFEFFESAAWEAGSVYVGEARGVGFELCLYKGEALEFLHNMRHDEMMRESFHIVYQDAFSPKKNPTLWSREYFSLLHWLLHPRGIITTYSQSKEIRENAKEAGLRVYDYKNEKVRAGSVMAKGSLNLPNLVEYPKARNV